MAVPNATATPAQLRAARAALGLSLMEAGRLASLSVSSVRRLEAGAVPIGDPSTLHRLVSGYEGRGTTFVLTDEGEGIIVARATAREQDILAPCGSGSGGGT